MSILFMVFLKKVLNNCVPKGALFLCQQTKTNVRKEIAWDTPS